ncbi:WxL protein host-binding domain-containing protein, partial [Enterococcus faecalis]
SKTYFDLSLPVNESVPLVIHVTNNSEEEIEVVGELSPATTNINGVVEYGKTQNQLTSSVPFDITKVASFEKEKQTIAPKQTVDFVVNVSVPTKDYAGIVAGGITLRDVTEEKTSDETKGMFKNKFAYAIALLVHGDKTPVENTVTLKEVTPTQVNSRNVVSAAIENKTANYINKVSIEASVTDASGKEVLSEKKEDMQIAPSSLFQFPIYYEKQEMKAGKYTLKMTVRSEKQEWQLKKSFTITEEKATALNKTDVSKKEESRNVQWLVLGLVGIIFLLLIILIVVLKKKK